jgi:hypothetical protein
VKRLAAIIVVAGLAVAATQNRPQPPADQRVRGIALGLFASTPDYDYEVLLDEIDRRGATDLLVVVTWKQANVWSSEVETDPDFTASDATIARTIRQARDRGMRVTVMPIVRLRERTANQWRGVIRPDPDAWFRSYGAHIEKLAKTAQNAGAHRFIIGSELGSMQHHDAAWRALIANTRQVFGGELAYSANWDAYDDVPFWDALDVAGVTGYFPMNSPDGYDAAWRAPRQKLADFRVKVGKPVILTEVGYPSHTRAAETPWDQTSSDTPAPRLQAELVRAFCDNAAEHPATDGYFVWNWFGFGGADDTGFSPRGKPAAAELERCLARRQEH